MGTRSVQTALSLALILHVQLHGSFGWSWSDQPVCNPVLFTAPRAVFQTKPTPLSVQRADLSLLNSVTLDCRKDAMVVTVNRDLFGIGYLVNSADLSVGSAGCSAAFSDSVANTVLFSIQLQDCGSTFQKVACQQQMPHKTNLGALHLNSLYRANPGLLLAAHEWYEGMDWVCVLYYFFNAVLSPCFLFQITGVVPDSPMSSTWVTSFTLRLLLPSTTMCRYGSTLTAASRQQGLCAQIRHRGQAWVRTGVTSNTPARAALCFIEPVSMQCVWRCNPPHARLSPSCLMDSKSPDSSSFTRPALNKLRFDITAFKFQEHGKAWLDLVNTNCLVEVYYNDQCAFLLHLFAVVCLTTFPL
ncbi:hypothetical protein HHUSO_G19987 [Huso huso]|uniref:ZP domain-containing protein n=1 Tax=Huso huso TaxID=61971 RepID=A0ABR0Z3N4_HUSHU